jgi:alpha/beta hydrolase fold
MARVLSEVLMPTLTALDPRPPLASPIYTNLTRLSPLLIHVGATETFRDDALALAKAAGAADSYVDLLVWPEMACVAPLSSGTEGGLSGDRGRRRGRSGKALCVVGEDRHQHGNSAFSTRLRAECCFQGAQRACRVRRHVHFSDS